MTDEARDRAMWILDKQLRMIHAQCRGAIAFAAAVRNAPNETVGTVMAGIELIKTELEIRAIRVESYPPGIRPGEVIVLPMGGRPGEA